ncbi:MAG: hypothetical protein RIT37_126, partial [Bacteroidota bacterium]
MLIHHNHIYSITLSSLSTMSEQELNNQEHADPAHNEETVQSVPVEHVSE